MLQGKNSRKFVFSYLGKSLTALTLMGSFAEARDIRLSSYGGEWRARMEKAVNSASSGDRIIIDVNLTSRSPYFLKKDGLTIQGDRRDRVVKRPNRDGRILFIEANNTILRNLTFEGGVQAVNVRSNKTVNNLIFNNLTFRNGGYTALDFRSDVNNVIIRNCVFNDYGFQVQTFDCRRITNFKIENCKFIGGDHQISFDNPYAENVFHRNIIVENCKFEKTKRFNVAFANTKNALVKQCEMMGGTGGYSQCLHIEDRSANIRSLANLMENPADDAILVYATDRIGHGDGRRLSNEEKPNFGSGPFIVENTVTRNVKEHAASVTWLKGEASFWSANRLDSGKEVIRLRGNQTNRYFISDRSLLKGIPWPTLRERQPRDRRAFVNF